MRDISEEKLLAIAVLRDITLFSAREKATLMYAETVKRTGQQTTMEQFSALREHFNDDAIIELTALISFQNLSSKFNAALHVPPQGFCPMTPAPAPENKPD